MKHFRGVHEKELQQFFHATPKDFSKDLDKKNLGIALGATLYIPGSMPDIKSKLTNNQLKNLTNAIICLEDSIADSELFLAENNVIHELRLIDQGFEKGVISEHELPLLFLRIRNAEQLQKLAEQLGSTIRLFTGIVFPKCTTSNAENFLSCLQDINQYYSTYLYALPILETKEIIYAESREQEITSLYKLFKQYEDIILTIRVGATDFTSLFGLRRPGNRTVYDIKLVSDCLTAILNQFTRQEDNFIVSGPVYDYFSSQNHAITTDDLNGFEAVLWNEVQLDIDNGFFGKTCIHPSQIDIVNAAYIVPKEIYDDARLIVGNKDETNGVLRSSARNKMNEVKPHYNWALKILTQAEIYGVLKENVTSLDFLQHIKNVQLTRRLKINN
ncbi:HpcH/HpaI aldolase/citrate lyase family protein [Psychrobacillus lasiicapitis]|uniref:HpcH/HpaI aldolase/citrate lyase family protein n=1 Tax=Psychrobacillus lasiicapitis TaxID=1636719 RepID=A0A544T740_9BACI|nr:HpcH/HpaI aldolase/citrate lyase family protein [Psychrobacillus lasiicapitis]TQR13257.1 HpcH/HpaI aldolase/citrate lyase family protein [Psychrobacillus lasiicapitis]GGA33181.1 ATP/GTP-binding protein [Psychrobacillus lasiicapitis]